MKRIAALAALTVTMLAVPATAAMASTGSSGPGGPGGPGYRHPRPVQVICLRPGRHLPREHKARAYLMARRHAKPVRLRLICPRIPAKPLPPGCRPRILRFDMAAGSSTMTEVSGPVLAPAEEFGYDGGTYTIMSVNPGAGTFTVFLNGWLFVNKGAAITDGVGLMGCTR